MYVSRTLPIYQTGTITGNSGSNAVVGTGTTWVYTDANGIQQNSINAGDWLVVNGAYYPIQGVVDGTHLTLWTNLSASFVGATYAVIRYTANQSGTVSAALAALTAAGTDASPELSWTVDSGAGRIKTRISGSGMPQIAVGPTGTADGSLVNALNITQTGAVDHPAGMVSNGGGPLAGFRNRIINGNFAVNQRGQVSGTALSAGAYGHDRWKAGASGCTYAFSAATPDTTITITAGSLQQVIEGANNDGGAFVLSWSGTATARVLGGSYSASPLVVSGVSAGASITVEFTSGTVTQVQFEKGGVASPFERRLTIEHTLCQRYYFITSVFAINPAVTAPSAGVQAYVCFTLPCWMRVVPSTTLSGGTLVNAGAIIVTADASVVVAAVTSQAAGIFYGVNMTLTANAEL